MESHSNFDFRDFTVTRQLDGTTLEPTNQIVSLTEGSIGHVKGISM